MKILSTRTDLSALNDNQRQAVLSHSKRLLVLAGAGSGKTNTLLQKINYLIDDEQADSSSIVAITFTKNAANEMLDRMIISADKSGFYKEFLNTPGTSSLELYSQRKQYLAKYPWLNRITFKTFHSLCYKVLKDDGVNVFDNQFRIVPKVKESNEFKGRTASETESEIIQKVTIQLSENRDFLIKLKRYILDYFVDYIGEKDEKAEFRPEGKFFTTLKQDKVRSKSEQFIADWMYRNSIEYVYEPAFKTDEGSFHPDFFIPAANIYIEHVSDLSHPTFWKEEKMKSVGATCIKTFDKATHNSAVFNQVLDKVIKGRISTDLNSAMALSYHEEFGMFKEELKKFYRQVLEVKSTIATSDKTFASISTEAAQSEHERVRLFYEVSLPIILEYRKYCVNSSYMDFDGLIDYTVRLFEDNETIRTRYQEKYKYVLVDEFQDVNNQQVNLLKLLINDETQLFCVGDDWQSIYGFRGSEVDYIVNFQNHFAHADVIKLNLNYRSTDHIVNASSEIIKKNKHQIHKEIKAVKKGGQKIEVHYSNELDDAESFIWARIQEHLQQGVSSEDILILYRRTAMYSSLKNALLKTNTKVQAKTIHGAKGLEARVVFVLGLHSGRGGFPDPWMHDKIYQVIKESNRDLLLEEERRLFYVALTRAKEQVYLISQKGAVSEFVKDIPKEMISYSESAMEPIENSMLLCGSCDAKMEAHFKFCPECGSTTNGNHSIEKGKSKTEANQYKTIINELPKKFEGHLDDQIVEARLINRRAYEPWSNEEDKLLQEIAQKFTVNQLSQIFGRSEGGIKSRLEYLNVES
jgi:superfamily I DNA/RNA helicase